MPEVVRRDTLARLNVEGTWPKLIMLTPSNALVIVVIPIAVVSHVVFVLVRLVITTPCSSENDVEKVM